MGSDQTIRQAVIIAGGLGTRAHSMTGDVIPKALLPLDGVPIVIRQMRALAAEGIERLCVLGGHLGAQLEPALKPEADALGMTLSVLVEASPLGTAGCLTTMGAVTEDTLIVYGDMLFDLDLAALTRHRASFPATLTILCHPNDHPRTSDIVVERDGYLTRLLPRKQPRDGDVRNLVPAGLYVASPAFFDRLTPGVTADMIHDVIPQMLADSIAVGLYDTPEYMRDSGSPSRHAAAEADIRAGRVRAAHLSVKRPAIFFDCDGVLNHDVGSHGIVRPDQVEVIDGAAEAVRMARDSGRLAIAVTNRPQVAKGFLDRDGLDAALGRLEAELAEGKGVLDRIYFCPHHPDRGFPGEVPELKIDCDCRKPKPGMILKAARELPVDLPRSVMIGDSLRDIGAARAAGIWAYGVRTGYGLKDATSYPGPPPVPDLVFDDVLDAVRFECGLAAIAGHVLSQLGITLAASGKAPVVAISGRSRAGKSTLAHALERQGREQGLKVLRVQLDRWIVPAGQRPPGMPASERNRVSDYPGIMAALEDGKPVEAPGYDAATRGAAAPEIFDPADAALILLEGVFAGHESIRGAVDRSVFVTCADDLLMERFRRFYRWKGLPDEDIEHLLQTRRADEWPEVDRQRKTADMIFNLEGFLP
jgi:histidinol-phosphate phosphatase family protein